MPHHVTNTTINNNNNTDMTTLPSQAPTPITTSLCMATRPAHPWGRFIYSNNNYHYKNNHNYIIFNNNNNMPYNNINNNNTP